MSKVTEWSSTKIKKAKRDPEEWHGRKYGHLTVIGESKQKTHYGHVVNMVTVMCDCGRVVETTKADVVSRKTQKTCEDDDCWYYQKEPARAEKPAIVAKLKPKYFCLHPAAGCTISSLCKICCHECDRSCKSCNNTPDKCGAKMRRVKNAESN